MSGLWLSVAVALAVTCSALTHALVAVRRRRRIAVRLAGLGTGQAVSVPIATLVAAVADRWRRRSEVAREADALPDVVDAIARGLRTGAPAPAAISDAAANAPPRLRAGLDAVVTAIRRGVPTSVAVDRWAAGAELEGAELLAAAMAVTGAAGGEPSRALTGVADTLRDRRALRREVRALSSQARLSASVIAVAPIVFAVVAAGLDRSTAAFLLASPLGWACVVVGVGLDVVGWSWMDRITRTLR